MGAEKAAAAHRSGHPVKICPKHTLTHDHLGQMVRKEGPSTTVEPSETLCMSLFVLTPFVIFSHRAYQRAIETRLPSVFCGAIVHSRLD